MVAPRVHVHELARDLRERVFGLRGEGEDGRVAVEVQMIPILEETGKVSPLEAASGPSTLELVRALAREEGWDESVSPAGVPVFAGPNGGAVSFEPGGQIEVRTSPLPSVQETLETLDRLVSLLLARGEDQGIRMLTRGIDPVNSLADAPLQLQCERYRRLARHFDRYGSAGRKLMRQTAAIHVNLDLGSAPLTRWRVANALAPVVTAIFANSPRYQGAETGHRSFRARQWREVDPLRVGLMEQSVDPVKAYLSFALSASAIFLGPEREPARAFRSWVAREGVDFTAWRKHLTTLYPEVRPRGYLEIRCLDALEPRWYAAPLVFLVGILYDHESLERVHALLSPPTQGALAEAGRRGVEDPARARLARDVFDLALEGARRLGDGVVGGEALERARAFYTTFTARGRDPGHEEEPESAREAVTPGG